MSQENVREPGRRADVLVHYRVVGGPVGVDQRLTVFDDGAVKLDERHRSRDPIWLRIDAAELEGLRAALDKVPARSWHRAVKVARTRMRKTLLRRFSPLPSVPPGANFQITRGSHAVVGGTADDRDLAGVVAALHALLVRAIRVDPR